MKSVIYIILTVLFVNGCSDSRWLKEFELDEKSFDSEVMQMIRKDTGLNLPESVRGLNFQYSPPVDPSFIARLELPEESFDNVLNQIKAIRNQEINISGGSNAKVDWWPPPKELVIIDRQCFQTDGDYFRAILTKEESRTILYINHAVL